MKAEVLYRKLLVELQAHLEGASVNLGAAQINQPIFLAGLAVGGAWLAERLAKDLALPQFGVINVAFHRDDYAEKGLSAMRSASSMPTHLPFEVNGAHIILIDDVLSTGRTVRAALNELFDFGRPAQVELMVLADRGKRELPIAADFVAEFIDLPEQQILALEKDADGHFHFHIEERHG
ncbi:MAG: bifunctional pyr operon transcriptional regulator/uracil phosphoribosyltransferase PyrR [Burkholderiales bacterium]|nr:bifunctional pyr operon transcriptional regulator/uracil phosphoribosyltransferase PyrR [Burkholderiales bacterium]